MKALKISLLVFLLAGIGAAVYFFRPDPPPPPPVTTAAGMPTSGYEDSLTAEIRALQNMDSVDLKSLLDLYRNMDYKITQYGNSGALAPDSIDNQRLMHNLSKDLFTAYATRFYTECLRSFQDSVWSYETLKHIKEESDAVLNSPYLGAASSVTDNMETVKQVLEKYWEIKSLIRDCERFEVQNRSLTMDFSSELEPYRIRINEYLDNAMQNDYVANCTSLRDELHALEQVFYRKHVYALEQLIQDKGKSYRSYPNQPAFQNQVIKMLFDHLANFDPMTYGVPYQDWQRDKMRLESKIKSHRDAAYKFFN